ncbi:MAG: hypothetical protein KJP05_07105 [Deltaproteobacteria bacterium]|nr:hypothetical protein [Deltaproteobacteria bacterium]
MKGMAPVIVRPKSYCCLTPDISSRPGVTATVDMTVLPGVLGYRTLRRTVEAPCPARAGFEM